MGAHLQARAKCPRVLNTPRAPSPHTLPLFGDMPHQFTSSFVPPLVITSAGYTADMLPPDPGERPTGMPAQ